MWIIVKVYIVIVKDLEEKKEKLLIASKKKWI
jgi:hypothetical protein